MGFFARLSESSDTVTQMAERLGLNIGDTVLRDGEQAALTYRAAVLRCSGCLFKGDCQALMGAETTLDKAPSYCRNHAQFEQLARV